MQMGFTRLSLALGFFLICLTVQAYAEHLNTTQASSFLLRGSLHHRETERSKDLETSSNYIEIDREARTIGSEFSLSNINKRQLPTQKFPFYMSADGVKDTLLLTIGYIRGVNTPEAHAIGQSNTDFVSGPTVIKLNGIKIHYLYTDGYRIGIRVPRSILKLDSLNVLQVDAGFYFQSDNQVAYDQIQFQHLTLYY
jgi:hypothetical protein